LTFFKFCYFEEVTILPNVLFVCILIVVVVVVVVAVVVAVAPFSGSILLRNFLFKLEQEFVPSVMLVR
jgi:hypothetical protein